MPHSRLGVPLLAMTALAACYPAARGGHHFLTPPVEQVTTTRPETVRLRYGTRLATTDLPGRDNSVAEDLIALGVLVGVSTLLDPQLSANMTEWPVRYGSQAARPPLLGSARRYYPLVRVTGPRADCTFFQPSPLPVRLLAWCPVSHFAWDATRWPR